MLEEFDEKHVAILVGARQTGKTFLLKKLEAEAKKRGRKTAFFDLEQPDIIQQFNKGDREVIDLLASSGEAIFIDEFHYLKNASHIFKAIYDSGKKIKIFASGSSSLEIHKHLKESMAGRKAIYKVLPCSLYEISQNDKNIEHYFQYGGLPGLIRLPDNQKKQKLLLDILQSYVLKDVKGLIKEENIRAFNNLLYLLAQYQGSTTAVSNLANETGLTAKTIEYYLEILAQTYINYPLTSFSKNYGNELKKSKKYYLYDLGIRNTLLKNFAKLSGRNDIGTIIESFVFLELNSQQTPETELRFWRLKDGTEVDFIWIKNQKPYPIEVKTTCKENEIPRGIKAFINKYPSTAKAFIINKNISKKSKYLETEIIYKKWEASRSIPMEAI